MFLEEKKCRWCWLKSSESPICNKRMCNCTKDSEVSSSWNNQCNMSTKTRTTSLPVECYIRGLLCKQPCIRSFYHFSHKKRCGIHAFLSSNNPLVDNKWFLCSACFSNVKDTSCFLQPLGTLSMAHHPGPSWILGFSHGGLIAKRNLSR